MKILVIGAAKSGVAAANWLAAHDADVRLTDRDANPPLPYEVDGRVERAFGVTAEHNVLDLPGVMSRKKQVAPRLLAAI